MTVPSIPQRSLLGRHPLLLRRFSTPKFPSNHQGNFNSKFVNFLDFLSHILDSFDIDSDTTFASAGSLPENDFKIRLYLGSTIFSLLLFFDLHIYHKITFFI